MHGSGDTGEQKDSHRRCEQDHPWDPLPMIQKKAGDQADQEAGTTESNGKDVKVSEANWQVGIRTMDFHLGDIQSDHR